MTGTRRRYALIAVLLLAVAAPPAKAARALVLNAYSAESLGLGGADIAVIGNTAAVNINPAGLTQIGGQAWDAYVYPYSAAAFKHTDSLGNDTGISAPFGAVLGGSYAQKLAFLPNVVAGIGLFAQGGTGFGYDNLLTSYGTRDKLSSSVGVFKLVGGLGWRLDERLSLGLSLGVSYAQGRQKFFPETSDAASSFFGLRFDGGTAVTPNAILGLQYHPAPDWTLAATYISKTPLPLTGGTATIDFDAIGLGHVKYAQARIDGLALPQEVDAGIAWRPDPRWLLALEFNWLDYSGAERASTLHASRPDNAAAPANIDAASPLHWRDQYVYAAGVAYTLDDKTVLRGGFNFENNPIPGSTSSPVLNLIQEREITFGFGRKFAGKWSFDFGGEYELPASQRYHNASLPLGASAKEYYEDISAIFALSRSW